MPEIAEVRTVAKTLNERISHSKIKDIDILYPNIIEDDLDYFANYVSNGDITNLETVLHQLEEKDKVIDVMLDYISNDDCPASVCWLNENFNNEIKKLCNCENCQDDYKKCWLKYFENEILERSKNDKR